MIYKHFGKEIIENLSHSILDENKNNLKIEVNLTEEIHEKLYLRIYESFIMGVDGIDNGVE